MSRVFFNDLEFNVPAGVYMPREDSYLAAEVLEERDLSGTTVLDIGTGCGFLAVIAADNGADVVATDINDRALATASRNAEANEVTVETMEGSLFEPVDDRFDTILFNAPYIPGRREGRDDEQLAWYGGEDGRAVIDRFINGVASHLTDDGEVLLVQSSVTGVDETLDRLSDEGLQPDVAARDKVSWEELVVIAASNI